MAVNRIKPHTLTYHDEDGDTLEIHIQMSPMSGLFFEAHQVSESVSVSVVSVRRDAVETIIASLTAWLKTGSLEIPVDPGLAPVEDEPK